MAFVGASILLATCALAEIHQDNDDMFAETVKEYVEDYSALELPTLNISYREYIETELDGPAVETQRQLFDRYERLLRDIDPAMLSSCNRVFHAVFSYEIANNQRRVNLIEKHRELPGNQKIEDGGINKQPLGSDWYIYLLDRWLNISLTPEAILEFGERELSEALTEYRRIQAELGYEGKDEAFSAFLNSSRFRYEVDESPLSGLLANQKTVWENMHRVFLDYPIEPATIKQSDLGDSFPVDAFYVDEEQVFYFNLLKEGFRIREMELMFLHEATPGHHLQNVHKNKVADCNTLLPGVYYHAYTEGWATYTETLGRELGVYTDPTSYLGWVEWDLVRSMRVILDIRINYFGWTYEQALAYWQKTLPGPGTTEIADREINRVTDWPAQAITYKIGADIFLQTQEKSRDVYGDEFDIREYHDQALKYGSLPLSVLESIFDLSATDNNQLGNPK